jgi:hypothetical protein
MMLHVYKYWLPGSAVWHLRVLLYKFYAKVTFLQNEGVVKNAIFRVKMKPTPTVEVLTEL